MGGIFSYFHRGYSYHGVVLITFQVVSHSTQGLTSTHDIVVIGTSSDIQIQRKFTVPPKHSRKAMVTRWFQKKECQVSNVKISFPRDVKIRCKFHDNRDTDSQKAKKTPLFLKDILKDCIDKDSADRFTATLEGKYMWTETKLIPKVEDPVPL